MARILSAFARTRFPHLFHRPSPPHYPPTGQVPDLGSAPVAAPLPASAPAAGKGLARIAPLALACVLAAMLPLLLAGCATGGDGSANGASAAQSSAASASAAVQDDTPLSIASLKGPTSIGLVALMQEENEREDAGDAALYSFDIEASADAIVPQLVQGTVDIALIPANLAATLYHKTDGAIRVVDVNTLGVLYGVSASDAFIDIASLEGATVYMTGKGTVPQYTLDALLAGAGLSESDLTVEFKSEPAEVVAALSADPDALGILPQPYVTAATKKNEALNVCLDLTAEWESLLGAEAGSLVTGVTVVRAEVFDEHPGAVARFLEDHARSAAQVVADPATAAAGVVEAGIVDSAAIAQAAIPSCNIVCLTGEEMRTALSGYLSALYAQDPSAVGGSLPNEDFYVVE